MFRKRKEPKRKSIVASLMRDMQGTAAEKLALFESGWWVCQGASRRTKEGRRHAADFCGGRERVSYGRRVVGTSWPDQDLIATSCSSRHRSRCRRFS